MVCSTCRITIFLNPPESAKVVYKTLKKSCNFVKILQCWKNLGMFPLSRFCDIIFFNYVYLCLPPCVLQRGRHHQMKGRRNIRSKNLDEANINIFFCWLKFWLFWGWAETSLNQFKQKPLKITLHRIAQPLKQVHRSTMWHMKDNGQGCLFCKRVFID